ncbi:MAG: hypothetical protein IJI87_02325 [Mogibacterium sp.]|nr:hypothetical protein [Mogibacterium sp.]
MDVANRISVTALRTLTYTILIKAVISAVTMICTIAEIFVLHSSATDVTAIGIVYLTAQTVGFINIAGCVMCLGGIAALSAKFVSTRKIMVTVLLIQCLVLVFVAAGLSFVTVNNGAATTAARIITFASDALKSLLTGAAFLLCMKGFGEVLRNNGDAGSAEVCERLGRLYLFWSIAGIVLHTQILPKESGSLLIALAVLFLVEAILEFLIYLKVSDAAFRIWRKRAFDYQIRGEN